VHFLHAPAPEISCVCLRRSPLLVCVRVCARSAAARYSLDALLGLLRLACRHGLGRLARTYAACVAEGGHLGPAHYLRAGDASGDGGGIGGCGSAAAVLRSALAAPCPSLALAAFKAILAAAGAGNGAGGGHGPGGAWGGGPAAEARWQDASGAVGDFLLALLEEPGS